MSMRPTAPNPATPAAASTANAPAGFSLRPSKQTAIILGSLIGVTLLGTVGFASWQWSQKTEREAVIATKTQQVNDSTLVAKQLDAKEAEFAFVQGRIGRLETSVSGTDYVPTLLKQIEALAKSNTLRVESQNQTFEPAPEPPADKELRKKFVAQPYDKELITLKVKGRYWDVARFLYRLTEFPKILSVDKLEFQPQGDVNNKSSSPLLSVTISMTGYLFQPTDTAPAPTESPAPGVSLPSLPDAPTLPPRREI